MKYSKLIILIIILSNVIFTSSVLYIFYKLEQEPTGLIIAWFGFCTGELAIMGSIKKREVTKDEVKEPVKRPIKETIKDIRRRV